MLEEEKAPKVRMGDIAKAAGISRQALYLHFPTRAELLVATARFLDEVNGADAKFASCSEARTGRERLDAFIQAWGGYIPEIYGVGHALLAMQDTDEAARAAWEDRMQAVRSGCRSAVEMLDSDGSLCSEVTAERAVDLLWTLLSVRNWEQLTQACGWSQAEYVREMQALAQRALIRTQS